MVGGGFETSDDWWVVGDGSPVVFGDLSMVIGVFGVVGAPAYWPAQANTDAPRASPPVSMTTTREGEDTQEG